jgi:hypothetical protein
LHSQVLVAGHYQPLADNVAIAATSDQTLPSAVDSESEAKAGKTAFASISKRSKRGGDYATPPPSILPFTTQKSSGSARDFCSN